MNDFRTHLQEELVLRCRKNPRYSLRSFARALGVNHGLLSMVLRKKRKLTPEMVQHFGKSLGLEQKRINDFVRATFDESARMSEVNQITIDTFSIISDWYHDAILELSRVSDFKGTPQAISRRLGITVSEARVAIERLIRVGLLEKDKNGSLREVLGDTATTLNIESTSPALRELQRQVLQLSLRALENVPRSEREHSSMTLAVRKKDLPAAKLKIREFRHQMMRELQQDSHLYDDVYQLAVSFYPLTVQTKRAARPSEEK